MASTPRKTVKTRPAKPRVAVGDEVMIRAKVTRVDGETVTVMIHANGQRTTGRVEHLLPAEPAE